MNHDAVVVVFIIIIRMKVRVAHMAHVHKFAP